MVITHAGEVGAYFANLPPILFRPSLRAMASIGTPREIVAVLKSICEAPHKWQTCDAIAVAWACAGDADISHYTGYFDGPAFVPGLASPDELLIIARHLMLHGVVGAGEKKAGSGPASEEFDAGQYAALAIAHLGMSEADAWHMTMTTLEAALRAKFPDAGKSAAPTAGPPSKAEHEATMAWFERIDAKRKKKG